jgi:hypothetical protein
VETVTIAEYKAATVDDAIREFMCDRHTYPIHRQWEWVHPESGIFRRVGSNLRYQVSYDPADGVWLFAVFRSVRTAKV